jgi:prepilin-type N-terminal cleavage/methylation domain-containing protein
MKVYCCKKFNMANHGFTLIEILVVVAIMALLAAVTLPVFFNMRTSDRKSTCASNMEAMGRALTEYYQDYKVYPPGPRPDYAMKVWANTSDAYRAIPLATQPNRGMSPQYAAIPIPPMNPTTGALNLLCYPRSTLKQQYKVTVTIVSGPTILNPALPYRYDWNCTNGSSGTGTVGNGVVTLFNTVKVQFTGVSFTVGETWEFYTFVDDNLKLGGAFSNPHAKNGILQLRYTITIQTGSTSTAPTTPNTYTWSAADSKNPGNILETGGPVTIQANTALPLSNGLSVRFDDESGHYVGDNWTFITVEAPFDTNTAGSCTWYDWRPRGTARLSQTLNAGTSTVAVTSLIPFDVPCRVTIRDAVTPSTQTTARIINVNPTAFPPTVTFDNPVAQTFVNNSVIDPSSGTYHLTTYSYMTEDERRTLHFVSRNYTFENYGLSYLYYKYLKDEGIYSRSLNYLHCPTDIKNDRIDRTLQINKLQVNDLDNRRPYDPLHAGYNKYDFTYNYDQYVNDITAFDSALGYGALHIRRQLVDPNPPADTVVSWCFQHRGTAPATGPYYFNTEANTFLATDGKTYITPDGQPIGTPIAGVTSDQLADDKMAEYVKQRDVVLWLDGSSGTVAPQIVKSTIGRYYWLPTFLTSSAEQR